MDDYYRLQAENGISEGHSSGSAIGHGSNRHLGRGFFTSALGLVSRALPFLGRSLLNTAVNVAEEMKSSGENETSVKEALKKSAIAALDTGLDTVKMKAKRTIMGAGRKRRRRHTVHPKSIIGSGSSSKRKVGGRRKKRSNISVRKSRKRSKKFSPYLW